MVPRSSDERDGNPTDSPEPEETILVPGDDEAAPLVVAWISPQTAALLGTEPEDSEGRSVYEVFGSAADAIATMAEDVLADGIPVCDYFVELRDGEGKLRILQFNAHRLERYPSKERHPKAADAKDQVDVAPGPAVALDIRDATDEIALERGAGKAVPAFHGIVGRSRPMRSLIQRVELYGPSEAPVIITGETGSGKELVARALHKLSRRRDESFVAVSCCALNEELFESELFGHEKGSFTGAVRQHRGRFERANRGTLFLDEIGDMSLRIQAKLLRVLEEDKLERVGGEEHIPVDVRILAATNIPLEEAVATGRFRADLYHRLAVFRLHVPALRERPGDIPLLVHHYLEILNRRYNRRVLGLTPDAMKALEEHWWPGNVRELRNVLERIYVETPGNVIGRRSLEEWSQQRDQFTAGEWSVQLLDDQRDSARVMVPPYQPALTGPARPLLPLEAESPRERELRAEPRERPPRELDENSIRAAFAKAEGNATEAARILGIHKASLYRRMKALGLTRADLEEENQS